MSNYYYMDLGKNAFTGYKYEKGAVAEVLEIKRELSELDREIKKIPAKSKEPELKEERDKLVSSREDKQKHYDKNGGKRFCVLKGKNLLQQVMQWTTSLPEGSILIGENAHFACPRTEKSKAQYFKEHELLNWYSSLEENGITLLLYAQKDTEKFRRTLLDLEKTDENDILSMAFSMHEAHISIRKNIEHLQKPKSSFEKCPVEEEGRIMREKLTDDKNLQRAWDYNEFYHCENSEANYEDKTVEWLVDHIEELSNRLTEDTKIAFGFDKMYGAKGQPLKNPVHKKIKKAQVLGVLLTLMNLDGKPRVRPYTGNRAGWDFVKQRFFLWHPYRPKRGGVVRASLMWDGMRHYITKQMFDGGRPRSTKDFTSEQWAEFKIHRNNFCKHVRTLWQTMRDMLDEQEQDSDCYTENSEFTSSSSELLSV